MRYGKECVCGRGEECKGISAAFALLKDPRRGYVAVPPFSADPVGYADRDMNDMRAAYLRHLNVKEESLGDNKKRRYVALHHFNPTVVQKHSQMKNAVSPIPKTLKKVDLRFLKMKLGDEDRVRDENGKKRKSYYFVPTYPTRKVKDDLKHMIRVSRLYAEAKIGTVPSPAPPRRRQLLPPGESSKEDRPTTTIPLEKEKGMKIGVDDVAGGKKEKDNNREKGDHKEKDNYKEKDDYKKKDFHSGTGDHKEIEIHKEPEIIEKIEVPEELEIINKIEVPEQIEVDKEIRIPEEPEIHKEIEVSEEPEIHKEIEVSEEPEIHKEIEVSEEPKDHKEIEVSEEPKDHMEIEVLEKPKLPKEIEVLEEPELPEKIEVLEETEAHEKIEVLEETEVHEKIEVPEETKICKEIEKETEDHQEKDDYWEKEDHNSTSAHRDTENNALEEDDKNDGDDDKNYDEEDDEKPSPLPASPPLTHQLSFGVQAPKTDYLNRNISQAETVGVSNQDDVPDYARMSMLSQADTAVFSNKKQGVGSPSLVYNVSQAETVGASNNIQARTSFTDTHARTSLTDTKPRGRERRGAFSRPSRQPFVKKSNDPILDIIIDTSEVEKKADDVGGVDVLATLEDVDEAESEIVEDEPLNLSERIFDHIWPEENLPFNMTMQSEEGRKFLFCRMATFEAYRHQVCAPLIQKFHARWRSSLEVMQAGIFETARAERLIRGNALANNAFSEAMQAMYDDTYLDEEGQIASGKRVQQRLMKEREGLNYSVEGGQGSTQESGEAHTKSALLGSLVDSQAVLAEKFSSHGHLVTDEVVTELSNLRSYLKTQMLDFKRKGDPLMREIQDSEAEILGAFSIFELIGAVPADYDGASMHSLNASRHTLQADGSWHGTPGSICSYKDGDDADDNSLRRGFFAKKMNGRTDQSWDNNSIGGATADTNTSIRFLSNPNSPLHAAIRANTVVRDGWLAEMLYRQAVNSQVMILKKCGAGLEDISDSMRRIEVNRETRIHELLLDFMPRQRRLYLGLSSISAPILKDLTSLRVDNTELARQVEDALKKHMQVLLKKDSAQRSAIMNRSRAQAPNLEDLHGVLTGEFFDNGLLRAATILERRCGVRGYWKPTLAVVTSDQYLHMFDLSFLPEVSVGTPPEFIFEMLLPDYDLPTIEGESVIARVDSLLKNLTPEITIHLMKCSSTGISSDPRSLEIVEDIKGRIVTNATRRFVLRAQRRDEAEQWLALLQSFESESTPEGESTGEPMRVGDVVGQAALTADYQAKKLHT